MADNASLTVPTEISVAMKEFDNASDVESSTASDMGEQPSEEELLRSTDYVYEKSNIDEVTMSDIYRALNAKYGCTLSDSNKELVKDRIFQLAQSEVEEALAPLAEQDESKSVAKSSTRQTEKVATPSRQTMPYAVSPEDSNKKVKDEELELLKRQLDLMKRKEDIEVRQLELLEIANTRSKRSLELEELANERAEKRFKMEMLEKLYSLRTLCSNDDKALYDEAIKKNLGEISCWTT